MGRKVGSLFELEIKLSLPKCHKELIILLDICKSIAFDAIFGLTVTAFQILLKYRESDVGIYLHTQMQLTSLVFILNSCLNFIFDVKIPIFPVD